MAAVGAKLRGLFDPEGGVELLALFADFEVEDGAVVVVGVGEDCADCLPGCHFLSVFHREGA